MAVKLVMPKLAMAMQQGTVVEWKVAQGTKVEQGQIVLVIETEKVNYECEAPASGFLHILVGPDNTVPVYEKLALVAATQAELSEIQAGGDGAGAALTEAGAGGSRVSPDTPGDRPATGKVKISPIAKKLAAKNNLDISRVAGSGPGGRILKADVEKALAAPTSAPEQKQEPSSMDPTVEIIDGKRVKSTIPVKGMRKAIADHMINSLASSAQLSVAGEVDMTRMIRLRNTFIEKQEEVGLRVSYTDLIIWAMAKAVKQVPVVNASLINGEIKVWEDINVSIAVSVVGGEAESGLIAPVLKDCGDKSLWEISAGVKALSGKARSGALSPEDLSGGTITISNVGMFGVGWSVSTPILNQPQAMLVQPGGIFEKPVARNGKVEIRSMMTVSITFDHRILDGGPVGTFAGKLLELLANPELLHM